MHSREQDLSRGGSESGGKSSEGDGKRSVRVIESETRVSAACAQDRRERGHGNRTLGIKGLRSQEASLIRDVGASGGAVDVAWGRRV